MLSHNLQLEVFEIAIAVGTVDNDTNGPIDAFHKAIGDPVLEIVEDLVPPVAQGLDEFEQEPITGVFSFPEPGAQETFSLASILTLFTDGTELFLEQIDGTQFR